MTLATDVVDQLNGCACGFHSQRHWARFAMGRPLVQGQNLASPQAGVANLSKRTSLTVAWYGGGTRHSAVVTGTGHWYRLGEAFVEVRWPYVHEWTGTPRDEGLCITDGPMRPQKRGV